MKIVEVKNKKQLKEFLLLPDKIYKGEKNYIKPLHLHTKMMLGSLGEKNKHLFLAYTGDDQLVARLAVKVHNQSGETCLHFGFYESLPVGPKATQKLFDHVRDLFKGYFIRGPYHFVMEDPYVGNLVHGYDQAPYIFMPFSASHYDLYLKEAGLEKSMDLMTFLVPVTECPKTISKIAERSLKRGAQIRWLDKNKLKEEVRLIADIFNDALSNNWGFEPITETQLDDMFLLFKYLIDSRLVCFLVKDNKEIGCVILIPNLNPALVNANGKISISFLLKFLKAKKSFDSARGYALGMRQGHHGTGNVCALIDAMYTRAREIDLKFCEISWVLENNHPMVELSTSIGGYHNKTYRIYERQL